MTDDEIEAVVRKYIVDCFESDNADGLHELDEWYANGDIGNEQDHKQMIDDLNKGYALFRKAKVTVTFDE